MIILKITQNGQPLDDVITDQIKITIGTAPDNFIKLVNENDSKFVRPHHARIDAETITISTVDSTQAGLLINDKLERIKRLENGDIFEIGTYTFQFYHTQHSHNEERNQLSMKTMKVASIVKPTGN